jgi:flagellar biosynthesis/type III secretory pathway chaperone
MEQPSPSNERLSSISLVNVDDFNTNYQEMTTQTRRIRQNNLINNIIRKGFNVSSSEKNSI